jgi:chromosome segregation ATPase
MSEEIHSIRSELEETTQHRIEGVESCRQDLRKELPETQTDLQTVKTSFDRHKTGLMKTTRTRKDDLQNQIDSF